MNETKRMIRIMGAMFCVGVGIIGSAAVTLGWEPSHWWTNIVAFGALAYGANEALARHLKRSLL